MSGNLEERNDNDSKWSEMKGKPKNKLYKQTNKRKDGPKSESKMVQRGSRKELYTNPQGQSS